MSEVLPYSWNKHPEFREVKVVDESLRDGLQDAGVKLCPTIDQKQQFITEANDLGVDTIAIGYPANNDDSSALAKFMMDERIGLNTYCIGRTTFLDVKAIVDLVQRTGLKTDAALFVGTSPIRLKVEGWSIANITTWVRESVSFARKEGLDVMLVTEDTTRSHPDVLSQVYGAAIDSGARRICIADTVGEALPDGVHKILEYVRLEIVGNQNVDVDWHGHNDKGMGVINAVTAAFSGASRVHATALGIGERAGNTAMHSLLMNLYLLGLFKGNIQNIQRYSQFAARMCNVDISANEPVIGSTVFTTETGVHAAAVMKADKIGLTDTVYSGVPAAAVGRHQNIVIGISSGAANVRYVCQTLGILSPNDHEIDSVLELVKRERSQLTNDQLQEVFDRIRSATVSIK